MSIDEYNQYSNDLIRSAFQGKYCNDCPNRKRVKLYAKNGIFPMWGAGNIHAPIIILFERPGNQLFLCESGSTIDEWYEKVPYFRKNYTEIMYSVYNDSVRYLDAILEFLYGIKSRNLDFKTRIEHLKEITYLSEVIKCPGKDGIENTELREIERICPSEYLHREWEKIIFQLPQLPILVIIATGLNTLLPSGFPPKVRNKSTFETHNSYFDKNTGIHYLKIWHPSYLNKPFDPPKEYFKKQIIPFLDHYKIPIMSDLGKVLDLKLTVYLLHNLTTMTNSKQIKEKILARSSKLL